MIKQIYTTGQAIQNELNRLYPKEHENFINDYYGFFTAKEIKNDDMFCIISIEKLKAHINYIDREGIEADCEQRARDYRLEQLGTMFERVIEIMQMHGIDKVNLLDTSEEKKILLDANIKDLNDYNARNTNFIEVKNYFCYLPEREKALINKHIEADNGANCYTEYTYDVGGKYFVSDALENIEGKFEDNDFETEEEKAFYTELKAVLEQISCDVIHY